jgi:hypothetical protein
MNVYGEAVIKILSLTSSGLGLRNTARVAIFDDDLGPPATNPIDDARRFVRQHYYDFLNRVPDPEGLDYWTSQITSCGLDQLCIRSRRIAVSDAFFFEPEFQETAAYVYRIIDREYNASFVLTEYFGYLRRDPEPEGYDFWLGQVDRFPIRNIDIQHAMVCSFITSIEYQQRFSPIVTHTNAECPQ